MSLCLYISLLLLHYMEIIFSTYSCFQLDFFQKKMIRNAVHCSQLQTLLLALDLTVSASRYCGDHIAPLPEVKACL